MSSNSPPNIIHEVIKSVNDKNEYYFDILPNGMKYIVASNPEIDRSAVGLDVFVGSAEDPVEYPGLAHLLEHVLFLGTKKYPEPSGFDTFLNNNSGASNANTITDNTNFHYDICHEKLEESIEMFSEFFKTPLFTKELINQELNAIENEFKLELRDDDRRLTHLILIEGYKDSHFNKFLTGNLETLKKEEIRDKVIQFYNNKYDAKIMSLSIFSNKTIEELKNIVKKYFSDIKSVPDYKLTTKKILYDNNNMSNLYKIISIKDQSYIYFMWIINKIFRQYYKSRPLSYVNSLLNHETKHSLTSYLKKKGYITSLSSSYEYLTDVFTQIAIEIKLTDEGYNNINKVISIVLSYINFLQKEEIHKDYFEEIKQISEINFYLDEQNEPIEFCENLSKSLNVFIPNRQYQIAYKIEEYKPDLIKEIFNSLTPQNLNIYILSNKIKNEKEYIENKNIFNIEKIYDIEYLKEKKDFNTFISDIKSLSENYLDYPELNPYLAKDLSMIDLKKENINIDEYKYPKKMYDNERIIWYKPVIKYNMPRVHLMCKAYVSNMNLSIDYYYIYFNIFIVLLAKETSDFIYFGYMSENVFSMTYDIASIKINVSGYSDSLEKYITEYFNIISKLVDIQNIDNIIKKLNIILDQKIESAKNFDFSSVENQTTKYLQFLIKKLKIMHSLEIYQKIKKELNEKGIPQEFLYFIKNFLKKVKYEWLVEGNITYKNAENLIIKIESNLNKLFGGLNNDSTKNKQEPLSFNEIRKQRIINLPNDKIYRYNFSSKDPKNESSTMLIYYQTGNFSFNDKNIINEELYNKYIKYFVLHYMMQYIYKEIFYDILRTEQQLGYDVSFSLEINNKVLGFQFYVCSSKYNPDEILEKINKFIIDYDINKEKNFTDDNFETFKKAIIVDFKEKPLNLGEEAGNDLSYVYERTYKFNQKEYYINYATNEMTKQDVIDFFNKFIFKKAKRLEVALYKSVKKEEVKDSNMNMEIEVENKQKKEIETKKDNDIDMNEIEKKNENDINNNINDEILPSYHNVIKEIIKDIDEFQRHSIFYDYEIY